MTDMETLAYVIHLRNNVLLLSKVNYNNWRELQEDYTQYMTSLGPWDMEGIIDYFQAEYGPEEQWLFSSGQVEEFMKSEEHILIDESIELTELQSISAIALQFNRYINDRNLEGLTSLMTDDHMFIDSENDVHEGKEMMIEGWKDFLNSYPDYRNIFEKVFVKDGLVIMLGYSICSYAPLDGPAIWTAKVQNGLLSEWRVYLDTPDNRSILGI